MSEVGPTGGEERRERGRRSSSDPGEVAMPRWVPRAIALALFGLALLQVGAGLLLRLRSLLVMLLVSLFLSFALEPAVNRLEARGVRRGVATLTVLTALVLGTVLFVTAIGTVLVQQTADFVERAPGYVEDAERWVQDHVDAEFEADQLVRRLREADVEKALPGVASNALNITMRAVTVIFQGFTVLLFTFYLVTDGPRFRRVLCSFLRPERQRMVLRGWEVAMDKTGGYIFSRFVLALAAAVSTFVVLSVMGVPYPHALSAWTGVVSQFVPTVGAYLGGVLPVLIALFEDPADAVFVAAFFVVYQQVENYLIAPRVTAKTMDLHPAVAFGSVIAGTSLLGGVGALLALPAAAVFQAIASTYLERHDVVEDVMTRQLKGPRRSPR